MQLTALGNALLDKWYAQYRKEIVGEDNIGKFNENDIERMFLYEFHEHFFNQAPSDDDRDLIESIA